MGESRQKDRDYGKNIQFQKATAERTSGKSGHCVNHRITEHAMTLRKDLRVHFPAYCRYCLYGPRVSDLLILSKSKDTRKTAREW